MDIIKNLEVDQIFENCFKSEFPLVIYVFLNMPNVPEVANVN